MERTYRRQAFATPHFAALVSLSFLATDSVGQTPVRMAYNPVTRRTEPEARPRVTPPIATRAAAEVAREPHPVEPVSYGIDHADCDPACGFPADSCASPVGCDPCGGRASYTAGVELTFLKPRFESNVAFTTLQSDGALFESTSDSEFQYDTELAPRVFIERTGSDGGTLRATWWQFDQDASALAASPPANGFGSITHPQFGDIDISTVTPSDDFIAGSDLRAMAIDLEGITSADLCGWEVGVGGGVRCAEVEQGYLAELRSGANTLRGRIDYEQSISGFGPTISLSAYRPVATDAGFFCKGRASVLFGDGESRLSAVEDADLTTPFTTTRTTNRDDLLSIGEVQLGFRWQSAGRRSRVFRPFLSAALEGQVWNGAGSATSEDGSLGFVGVNAAVGTTW
ncbi:MAG: hypothetical protein ACRCT8_07960 [Lacipirellulaceae bacterium]